MIGRVGGCGGRGREDGFAGGFTRGESTERHLEEDEDLPEPIYAVLDEQENTDGYGYDENRPHSSRNSLKT